jgi:hypothetical protein
MSTKGFGKKEKSKDFRNNFKQTNSFKQNVVESGNRICSEWRKQAKEIRLKSEEAYGCLLIEARFLMISVLSYLQISKEGIPGKTNEHLGEILRLIAIFWQGQFDTERLISEGQYIKASAVIKQEIEIITRIAEIKKGVAKEGKPPNVKYAPSMLNLHYGDMNDIAHISKPYMLDTLTTIDKGSFSGVSIQPIFHGGIAKNLYEIHLCIFYNIVFEAIELVQKMYSDDIDFVLPACQILAIVNELMINSGLINSTKP